MKFTGFIGVIFLLGIAYILSNNRKAIKPRTVFWGIGLQLLFAVVILKIPFVKNQFSKVDNIFKKGEKTLLLTVINKNNQRRYLGVKIN